MKKLQIIIFLGVILNFTQCQSQLNNSDPMNTHSNKLALASSPYLLQHAHNPVEWYEWGEEALTRARKENKPLLISIGYAACHWCHVMAHESFEDTTVAAYMNAHFVNIKIDREERPDIDQLYMDAAQLISGRGGWPLNAFALPDGRPFYAGTYFPKDRWMDLLKQIHNIYQEEYGKLEEQARSITEGINQQEFTLIKEDQKEQFEQDYYKDLFKSWETMIDFKLGGYAKAPKFPLPVGWEFLLQYHYLTGNSKALNAVEKTLDEMAKGGIYDQIGGGFARYSVDKYWKAPHFEKMLYDNGQLVSLYSHAYQVTKKPRYASVIRQTLSFVERELSNPDGGFYSSLDADSEGEEGRFYVWTFDELQGNLYQQEMDWVEEFYQLKKEGNWEHGQNILHSKLSISEFEMKHSLPEGSFEKSLNNIHQKLLKVRSGKTRPGTDDKILTSWNALMLKGYLDAYRALGDQQYLQKALQNARFLEKNMTQQDGSLKRNYKNGKASITAFLDDYALLAMACIHLYQSTFDIHWLNLSKSLSEYVIEHFSDDKTGLFFYTSDKSENLFARKHEVSDNVIPSSNSVMARVLYQLGLYYDDNRFSDRAISMLKIVESKLASGGPYYANWGMLFGTISHKPYEVAIMGNEALPYAIELQTQYLPTTIFMGGTQENLPLLKHKLAKEKTLIYVCRNKVCDQPVDKTSDTKF